MNFSKQSEAFIKKLNIKSMPKIGKKETHIKHLYRLLLDAHNRVKTLEIVPKMSKINNVKDIVIPSGFNSKFIPEIIRESILMESSYSITYEHEINNRKIRIYFTCMDLNVDNEMSKYVEYIRTILMWFNLISYYSNNTCSNRVSIHLFMTEFKKKIPKSNVDVIDVMNVNSGLSDVCARDSEIIIYRREEWLKVLIHETFHNLGLEFSSMNIYDFQENIRKLFPIESNMALYETWAESWAVIINVGICAFFLLDDKKDEKDFVLYYEFLFLYEKMYSCFQLVKVLNHMGLTYDLLIMKDTESSVNKLYKEKTNVFAYYILKCIVIYDHIGFLSWCKKNNPHWMKFLETKENLESFFNYIKKMYKRRDLLNLVRSVEIFYKKEKSTELKQTLRMTLTEIL